MDIENIESISHRDFIYGAMKVPNEEKVFFTSDLHFDHDREFIWGVRGYQNVQEMNETQVRNWNSVITNEDTVFYLGDLKFGRNYSYEDVLRKLNFKKIYLMAGNHYSGFQDIAEKMIGHCGYVLDGHKTVQPIPNYFELWHKKQGVVLCHYPIGSWNHNRNGSFQLFGHCHGTYKNVHGKQLDVGFDNFPVPQNFDQIHQILNKKSVEIVDGQKWFGTLKK